MLTVIFSPATMIIVVVLGVSALFISRALRNDETDLKVLTNLSLTSSSEKSPGFGAYRVREEVGKLLYGQLHRREVLASRAAADRQAIEASLLKAISAAGPDDGARSRAQIAFEQYGFVAQHCATLLSSSQAFYRATAARILGQVKSPSALPFLFEALYDQETTVRNQVIVSIGQLGLPSALGPLLEAACVQEDIPHGLLRKSLTFCAFGGEDFQDPTGGGNKLRCPKTNNY